MIDAILATSFDCHHPFPSSSPAPSPPSALPLVSHTRTQGSGSNSIQHAAKINGRQKEMEQGGPRGRNRAKWRGNTFLDSSVVLCNPVHLHLKALKQAETPASTKCTSMHFVLYHSKGRKITPVDMHIVS